MYEGLDFPIELGIPDKIESFNGWDARKYFNWLINCIPDRVEYLKNYITSTYHININDMYHEHTLQIVNNWYDKHVDYYFLDKKDVIYYMGMTYDQLSLSSKTRFTTETNYISMDVSLYLCDYICKKINGMYWTIYKGSKKDLFHNRPVVKCQYNDIFKMEPNAFINKYNINLIEKRPYIKFGDFYIDCIEKYGLKK